MMRNKMKEKTQKNLIGLGLILIGVIIFSIVGSLNCDRFIYDNPNNSIGHCLLFSIVFPIFCIISGLIFILMIKKKIVKKVKKNKKLAYNPSSVQ